MSEKLLIEQLQELILEVDKLEDQIMELNEDTNSTLIELRTHGHQLIQLTKHWPIMNEKVRVGVVQQWVDLVQDYNQELDKLTKLNTLKNLKN